mgnify:CR=1 FL=1
MSETRRSRIRHMPGLDGARGLWVVLGPLLYHARPENIPGGPSIVPGGILSLDLFFVLSSFLIVTIALKEWDTNGWIDLKSYAGRRARRLLPALLTALVGLTFYLVVFGEPEQTSRWTGAIVSALTYSANWHEIAADISYFEHYRTPSPLKHIWSFSIEEQFYIFAPLFLIGVLGVLKKSERFLLWIASIGAVASAVWMAVLHNPGQDPSRVYFGTDTRAQALFVGIILALVVRKIGPPKSENSKRLIALAAYPATAFHLWAVLFLSQQNEWMFESGGFLLIAVMSAVIIYGLTVSAPWSPLHRFMESLPLRYLGRISYGLYLYHWPVYMICTGGRVARLLPGVEEISGVSLLFFHLALTGVLASISFHLIERPFQNRHFPILKRPTSALSGTVAASLAISAILFGLLWVNTRPADASKDFSKAGGVCVEQGLLPPPSDPRQRVLVVGDSISVQIAEALCSWSLDNPGEIVVMNEAHLGCVVGRYGQKRTPEGIEGPVGELCSAWNEEVPSHVMLDNEVVSWPTAVELFRPDVVIGHITPWDVTDRQIPSLGDDWVWVGTEKYDRYISSEYRLASEVLGATGADIFWLEGAHLRREMRPQNHPDRIDALNSLVAAATSDLEYVSIAPYKEFIGELGSARELRMRDDGVHLTEEGLIEVSKWLIDDVLGN